MSMLTLTSKTRFGAMRGCQEQICEARGPKRTIFANGVGCYIWYQRPAHWLFDDTDGVVGLLKGGGL
jgi:hypothetical protein